MRTKHIFAFAASAVITVLGGCTVKDVDTPALSGPSTFVHSIQLTTDRDTLTLNGMDSTEIRITSTGPTGQSENIPLRAQVFVNGVPMDFGTLSTKTPITPATVRYTAPPPSAMSLQQPTTVSIRVTPTSSGDFRSEVSRQVELLLIPQGVILPSNPNLVASFSATPNPALVLQTVAFDASATTASGTDGARALCDTRCTYSWSFGDGRSGSGIRPFHTYTTIGTYLVTLTVVDPLGAQAQTTQTQTVNPGVPPTATFSFSPSSPGIDQVIFFNATAARPATGRTIVSYDWDFGDGTKASGMTTTHSYKSAGQFPVILRVTDDAGTVGQVTPPTTITVTATAGVPTAAFTFSPTAPAVNQQVFFDGSTSRPLASNQPISQYRWDFGDGSPDEVSENSRVTHVFRRAGTYVVRLTVTDSTGKIGTTTVNVAIQ